MRTTVCVIDDEFRARERVRDLLSTATGFEVIGEADNGPDAVELIDRLRPDLVFLDISMPGLSGFQVLAEATHTPAVIFVTAYDEHAVRAFDVHAVDYLLKPFQNERFREALSRVDTDHPMDDHQLADLRHMIEGAVHKDHYLDRLTVKDGYVLRVIPVTHIEFFIIEGGLVYLHTADARYRIDRTLSDLEATLDPRMFFRAHRKALVNLDKLDRIVPWGRGRYALRFPSGNRVHLGKERRKAFRARVGLE